MKRLLPVPLILALGLPLQAEIDPKVREACLAAADFLGCVKAYSGKAQTNSPSTVITNEGFAVTGGNKCPTGFASDGAGYCSRVRCEQCMSFGCLVGNDPVLANKNWKCHRGLTVYLLRWGDSTVRASQVPECPAGPIEAGFNSTCEQREFAIKREQEKKLIKKSPAGVNCDSAVWRNKPECMDY